MIASTPVAAAPVAVKRKPKPFDPADPAAGVPVPGEFMDDGPKLAGASSSTAPWDAAPKTTTAPPKAPASSEAAPWAGTAPVLTASTAPGTTPTKAAAPAPASAPTAVPDGSGGAIPVPPVPAVTATPGSILTTQTSQVTGQAMGDTMPAEGTGPSAASAPWMAPMPAPTAVDAAGVPVASPASSGAAPLPSTFTADQNLINSQIGPTASQRALDLQAAQDAALGKITNGPDRFALAREAYDDFTAQADSDVRRAQIDAKNAAAEGGYLGSGRLTNAYGDVEERRQLADLNARREFLRPALEGTIQDNLNNLGATRAAANDAYGQDAQGRDETRGERDYQRNLAEQAITRRIQQQAAEAGLTQQEFDNAMRQYQLGNLNDPTATYENAAQNASQEASGAGDDVAALLRAYAARRAPVAP